MNDNVAMCPVGSRWRSRSHRGVVAVVKHSHFTDGRPSLVVRSETGAGSLNRCAPGYLVSNRDRID